MLPSFIAAENPRLTSENSFSMLIIPAPQNYNKFEANQALFELTTTWIATNFVQETMITDILVQKTDFLNFRKHFVPERNRELKKV